MFGKNGVTILFFIFLSLLVTASAWAVPGFSRQTKEACSYCHSQWPLLNNYGKEFKANGFKGLPDGLKISKDMLMPENFPISGRFNFRLADKRFSKKSTKTDLGPGDKQLKFRGLHEAEIFIAGKLDRAFYFVEFESEDEWSGSTAENKELDGFEIQMVTGYGGYRLHPLATFHFGFMSPFVSDGNNTVYRMKPARYQWSASSKGFVPGVSQGVSVHGHVSHFSYILAYHGIDSSTSAADLPGKLEGKDPKDKSIRVVYEMTGFSIGGFYSDGKRVYDDTQSSSRGSNDRWGIDLQYDGLPGLQVNAIYGQKKTKEFIAGADVTTKDNNFSFYTHYFPVDHFAVGVNYDTYTDSDGANRTSSAAIFATCFIKENLKAQLGWEGTLSTPSKYLHDESRATFVIDLGI